MEDTETLKSKAVRGVAWGFIGTTANKGIQFVISLILARLLTPADYGLIGMLGFFMGLAGTFIDSGFSSALIQKKDRDNRDYCTVFYINLGMSFLMYGLLYVSAPWISDFYNEPRLTNIVRIYSLTFLIGAFTAINSIKLTIALDYKTGTIIGVASNLISAGVGLWFAFYGYGVWALIAQQLAASVLRMILFLYFVRWWPSLVFSIESFKKLFKFGSKLLASSLLHTAYTNMYPMVIGKRFSASDLGYVTRAQGFNDIIANNISGTLVNVAYPLLAKIPDDDARLMDIYGKYMKMSSFLLFPLILFICGIAKPMILFLLTDKWAPSIHLLQILSFSYIWQAIIRLNLNLLYVKGRSDLFLRLEIVKKVIAVAIMITTAIIGNLTLLCIGMTVYSAIALYLNTYYTKRLLNFGLFDQLKQVWPYLLFSLIVLVEGLVISYLVSNSLIAIIAGILVCLPTYIALNYFTRQYAFAQIVEIISPRLGTIGQWMSRKIESRYDRH